MKAFSEAVTESIPATVESESTPERDSVSDKSSAKEQITVRSLPSKSNKDLIIDHS